jgi:hypothetical protein
MVRVGRASAAIARIPFRDLLACTAIVGRQLGRLERGMRLPLDHHAGQGAGDAVNDLDAGDHQPA